MKTDIKNRVDIERIVNLFYEKVRKDASIGFFFTEIAQTNWEKHLPIMYQFWENIVFSTGTYEGNPMIKHREISQLRPITMDHFQHWIHLFNETVNELFQGEKAELNKVYVLVFNFAIGSISRIVIDYYIYSGSNERNQCRSMKIF